MKPEDRARVLIDDLLLAAGWHIYDMAQANIHAAPGVALREFALNAGHGAADYLTIAMASDGVFKLETAVSTGTAQMTVPLAACAVLQLDCRRRKSKFESSPKSTATCPPSAKSNPR